MIILDITKELLILFACFLTIILLMIFAFILVGISAFSVPGAFGSVVNSLFPVGK